MWFYFALMSLASGIRRARMSALGELLFGREEGQYTNSEANHHLVPLVRMQPLKGAGCRE